MYYLLCIQEFAGQQYTIEFGDKDKPVVRDELRDLKDSGTFERHMKPKIITSTSMRQADCNIALQLLNASEGFDE